MFLRSTGGRIDGRDRLRARLAGGTPVAADPPGFDAGGRGGAIGHRPHHAAPPKVSADPNPSLGTVSRVAAALGARLLWSVVPSASEPLNVLPAATTSDLSADPFASDLAPPVADRDADIDAFLRDALDDPGEYVFDPTRTFKPGRGARRRRFEGLKYVSPR